MGSFAYSFRAAYTRPILSTWKCSGMDEALGTEAGCLREVEREFAKVTPSCAPTYKAMSSSRKISLCVCGRSQGQLKTRGAGREG
jgi:hypothetical protein